VDDLATIQTIRTSRRRSKTPAIISPDCGLSCTRDARSGIRQIGEQPSPQRRGRWKLTVALELNANPPG
jgi:hypothetical protein